MSVGTAQAATAHQPPDSAEPRKATQPYALVLYFLHYLWENENVDSFRGEARVIRGMTKFVRKLEESGITTGPTDTAQAVSETVEMLIRENLLVRQGSDYHEELVFRDGFHRRMSPLIQEFFPDCKERESMRELARTSAWAFHRP